VLVSNDGKRPDKRVSSTDISSNASQSVNRGVTLPDAVELDRLYIFKDDLPATLIKLQEFPLRYSCSMTVFVGDIDTFADAPSAL
jgi:hypothetical protein